MVDLELHPNEASDLAVVPVAVERFDQTFVTVLDEGVIEESIAVLGHRGDDVSDGLGGDPSQPHPDRQRRQHRGRRGVRLLR